jgi:hypothetical protein
MAELSDDIVLKISFDDGACDRRFLERLLSGLDGVTAFKLMEDGTLIVAVSSADGEDGLVRSFEAAGIYPRSAQELGHDSSGGRRAC